MKAKHLIVALFALAIAAPVSAAPISFNFNSIALNSGITTDGLSGAANSTAITNYMRSVLGACASCVTVSGALATLNYNADGAGVGQTLGTSDGATAYNDNTHPSLASPDKFIMNDNFGIYSTSNSITIAFTNLAIGTLSFDWEIFADNNCSSTPCTTNPTNANFPQFDLIVDGTHQGATPHTFSASVIPGQDPQGLGTASFVLNLAAGPHTLQFVDWPPEIGIDNLTIQTCRSTDRGCLGLSVPEPSPLSLAGLALAFLVLVRWGTRRPPRGRVATIRWVRAYV